MYVTQIREQALKDIILGVDGELFERVTGLAVDDFKLLNQIGVFNPIHMNAAIYQFKAFEDSSLEYAHEPGVPFEHRPIGLWDTVMQPDESIEDVLERVAHEDETAPPAAPRAPSKKKAKGKGKAKGKKK